MVSQESPKGSARAACNLLCSSQRSSAVLLSLARDRCPRQHHSRIAPTKRLSLKSWSHICSLGHLLLGSHKNLRRGRKEVGGDRMRGGRETGGYVKFKKNVRRVLQVNVPTRCPQQSCWHLIMFYLSLWLCVELRVCYPVLYTFSSSPQETH